MTDPLLRLLDDLPPATLDPDRADRIRARCHAALARGRRIARRESGQSARRWPSLAVALGGLYLTEVLHQVLEIYRAL
jgi:hypothetical protein